MREVTKQQVSEAVAVLKDGGVVVFPSETSYGLAVDATNAKAVARLMKLKGRSAEKSLPVIVASTAMAERVAHLRCIGRRLAKAYWPGALTLVSEVKKGSGLAKKVVRDDGTIALRVSENPVARALSKGLQAPITATSANKSEKPAVFDIKDLKLKVDYVLDCGKLPKKLPTTIVRVVEKKLDVLREGEIKPKDPRC